MADKISFTRNYSDLSTNEGFQFEFHCNRCGNGYRSKFKPSAIGKINNVLGMANGLLGGLFGKAADAADRVRDATWEKAHDSAFTEAMNELRPDFVQCPRCQSWVCKDKCWNGNKGLCKECAPDLGVEMAAAQANKSVEEVWAHAAMAEEDKKLGTEVWREGIRATCPDCGKPLTGNSKFCPECGAQVKKESFCAECGSKLAPAAKFCPDCGTKAG